MRSRSNILLQCTNGAYFTFFVETHSIFNDDDCIDFDMVFKPAYFTVDFVGTCVSLFETGDQLILFSLNFFSTHGLLL